MMASTRDLRFLSRSSGKLEARPHAAWTIERVSQILYHDYLNRVSLMEFVELPGLAESWRKLAEARLSTDTVESWARRIETTHST